MKNNIFIFIFIILLTLILIYNKRQIYSNLYKNKKYKIIVIIHGFAPRSLKYTYESIQEKIIDKLRNKYDVDVYHYSLLSKDGRIDSSRKEEYNMMVNNDDCKLLLCKRLETEYQENIKIHKNYSCTNYNEENLNINFMRSLSSELECIKRFPVNDYDICIMVSSDSLILNEIDYYEVEDSYKSNCLYTTNFNKWGGVANGFYICPPNILNKICSRFNNFPKWCNMNKNKNAEQFLKWIVSINRINNKDSKMFYLKIRATGKSNHYIELIDNYNIKNVNYIKLMYEN